MFKWKQKLIKPNMPRINKYKLNFYPKNILLCKKGNEQLV